MDITKNGDSPALIGVRGMLNSKLRTAVRIAPITARATHVLTGANRTRISAFVVGIFLMNTP